jgi:catechol 2,3-dioxygenase-like lactoylglutathione lyase family enzyme
VTSTSARANEGPPGLDAPSAASALLAGVIDHIGFEVANLERSARFYDAVFFALGARRMHESEAAVSYGVNGPEFWITARDAPAPRYGHVALKAAGKAAVDAAYSAGLRFGGSSAGEPGPRPHYGQRYYAAYLRDPDGLRIELVSAGR